MLAAVRRSAKSWAAAAILFIALLAIVITGFGTGGFGGLGSLSGGANGTVLATVDGRTLTDREVVEIVNRQYAQARQQQADLAMPAFLNAAFGPIVDQMIIALAIQAFGEDQGLVVSDRMIDREIVGITAFHDAAGRFDDSIFRRALAAQNLNEGALREDIARSLMQRQLLGPLARGAQLPEALAREYANLMFERRRGTLAAIPAAALTGNLNPTPAEIATFYQNNRARFTVAERRVLRYATIGPAQIAEAARATEAEIAAFYRQNAAAYGPRETRDLQHIPFPDQAAANRFAAQLRSGTSFEQAAQGLGFRREDITASGQTAQTFTRLSSAEAARAAFAGQAGSIIGPIRSPLGFHVIRVAAINRVGARPLGAVRGEIAAAIEQRKRADALETLISRVEDRLSEGASLEEVARAERLTLTATPPLTSAGLAPGTNFTAPAELQPILRAGFEIDPDDPEPVVEQIVPNQSYAVVALERAIPAAPPPLAQIQNEVRRVMIDRIALERARNLAQQAAAQINRGMPAAQALAATRVAVSREVNMQRQQIAQAGTEVPAPLAALFAIPQGRAHVLPAPDGTGWFVVYHAQRTPGDASVQANAVSLMRRSLEETTAEEIAQQFARAVNVVAAPERNEEAIARIRRDLLGVGAE